MNFSQFGGALANAAGRIQRGILKAGVDICQADHVISPFCDSEDLERAAEKFGREQLESRLKPEFTQLAQFDLVADFSLSPDEILRRGGQRPSDWEFRGVCPKSGISRVWLVVGSFNKAMTRGQMLV